jgi:hypothetical protein
LHKTTDLIHVEIVHPRNRAIKFTCPTAWLAKIRVVHLLLCTLISMIWTQGRVKESTERRQNRNPLCVTLLWCKIFENVFVNVMKYTLLLTENSLLIGRLYGCPWRAAKLKPMHGVQGLWAERDLYLATSGDTGPRLFRSRSSTGPHSVAFYVTQADAEDLL